MTHISAMMFFVNIISEYLTDWAKGHQKFYNDKTTKSAFGVGEKHKVGLRIERVQMKSWIFCDIYFALLFFVIYNTNLL